MSEQDHNTYLGSGPCGCATLALSAYGMTEKQEAAALRREIKNGYTIEKLPAEEVRARMVWDCPHHRAPKAKEEIDAEVERLMGTSA